MQTATFFLIGMALTPSTGVRAYASGQSAVASADEVAGRPHPETARIISEAELKTELESHRGRAVILHFWASWCVPCLAELPLVARLAQDSRRKGVDFLAVSLDNPSRQSAQHVSALLAQRIRDPQWSAILKIADADAFMTSIDPNWEGAIPVFFAYDQNSRLRRSHLGNINQVEFDELISDLTSPLPSSSKK
jgi:thiol-disulfide isomerase/thioredoxin